MSSRFIMRSFVALATVCGFAIASTTAQAGIIVTVGGEPCPDMDPRQSSKPSPGDHREQQLPPGYSSEGDTRCVVMPDGQTRCGETMRVETVSMLPADWRCVSVGRATLYCETPNFGGSPGAAGEGDFDPDAQYGDTFDDEEIQALGCSGGGAAGGLLGLLGVGLLVVRSRRRAQA